MSILKTVVLAFINDVFGKLSLSAKVHLDILEKYRTIDLIFIQNVSGFSEHLLYYLSIILLLSYSHYLSPPIPSSFKFLNLYFSLCVISHYSQHDPLCVLQFSTYFLTAIFAPFTQTLGFNHSTQAYKGQRRPTAVPRAWGMAWGVFCL